MLRLRPWRLPLHAIDAPVHVWFGTEDVVTPPELSRRVAELVPRAEPRELAGEGHLHLLEHWAEGLAAVRERPTS